MTIKQLSVFLENKTGRINEVTKILGKHSINMTRSAWQRLPTLVFFA